MSPPRDTEPAPPQKGVRHPRRRKLDRFKLAFRDPVRDTLALVLAGGRGSRLVHLTAWRAKPAVPFGGKFRIIDFALSNCLNSGIRHIGVLTQYKAHSLIQHLHRGWSFLKGEFNEYVELLPAQQRILDTWYSGTADAVYQNIDIIRKHGPDFILILAGDHVYKADYGMMIQFHLEREADLTVGCVEVPLADATHFGVMAVDRQDRVKRFEEKPVQPEPIADHPEYALASMGIYVFNADFLFEQLSLDAESNDSEHDFGKNIIPAVIHSARVVAYPLSRFQKGAYWRDVGTVDAYYQANLELIGVTPELNLYDANWPIWTYQPQLPPAKFVFDDDNRRGLAVDSMVSGGCIVSGATVRHSILFSNVRVNSYSVVEDSVLLPQVTIGRQCCIEHAIIEKGCRIPPGTKIGVTMPDGRLDVVLCWHMHQPQYQDLVTGRFEFPWTYLHTIKDYVDMAAHLEDRPDARAVCNFSPILLEQIVTYADRIKDFLRHDRTMNDPLLDALCARALPEPPAQRKALVRACLRANEERVVHRYAAYQKLVGLAKYTLNLPGTPAYLNDAFLADLVVWYHLAWLGESVHRSDATVARLVEQGHAFTPEQRRELLQLVGQLIDGVIGRYRRLAEHGQAELSLSPYGHPIIPLLIDIESAHETMPEAPLPELERYPGGIDRARWHIRHGLEVFHQHFGRVPAGCWPSEGGLSQASLPLYAEFGLRWVASGGAVLKNSVRHHKHGVHDLDGLVHGGYQDPATGVKLFFRDDGLSDLIGFQYAQWRATDAVADLIHHLETIARERRGQKNSLVAIIMDGENAWEYYPNNGHEFLSTLYRELTDNDVVRLTTFEDWLSRHHQLAPMPTVTAGSWVYGTFSTWVGAADKNRAWDMLGDAKRIYDARRADDTLSAETRRQIDHQLAICESSDWFWWFGDYNPAETVGDFERLYRRHLSNLYQLLGAEPPAYLAEPFTYGEGTPALGGVMRPGTTQR